MILDLQLAKGTGFGVLSQLRDKRPVTVVLTNYALPEYRRRALASPRRSPIAPRAIS